MKTLQYRIRVITLALVSALFISLLLYIRSAWAPAFSGTETEPSPSSSAIQQEATPSPDVSPSGITTQTPEPLFDTYGL